MIRKRTRKAMDKFIKQFLPVSMISSQQDQQEKNNNKQSLIQRVSSLPPTPPSTPNSEMSAQKIAPEDAVTTSPTAADSAPTLRKRFMQVSKSLFNRPVTLESIDAQTKSLPTQMQANTDTSKLVFATKFDELRFYLDEIRNHFENVLVNSNKNDAQNSLALLMYNLTSSYLLNLEKCLVLNENIMKNAANYDYEQGVQYNGYRTLSATLEKCCAQTLLVVKNIFKQKQNFLFQMKYQFLSSSIKEYETWCLLIEKLHTLLTIASEMQQRTMRSNSLFVHQNDISANMEKNLFMLASTHQEAFFGRTCAFQFCESLKLPLTACTVALASYNDGYDEGANNDVVRKTAKSLFSSTKYMLNPEMRAKKLGSIMKNADVNFCKAFWQLTETPLVKMGSDLITPALTVTVVKTLEQNVLTIDKADGTGTVEIQPPINRGTEPTPLNIRILSAELRQGMEGLDKSLLEASNGNKKNVSAKSPYLILHCHGGGFIAHSSKSHEIYLKPWCKELHIPIVSIDYSLAPEEPFPKASEECFYVYVWCLLNKDALGWTGEKIVCVGDSAGGVLVTNIVQRAILAGVRIPDALVPIYAPFLLSYSLSPSRLMSVMDPLLNLGILWRCLAAYCGIDFKSFDVSSPSAIRKLIEANKEKLTVNSEVKKNELTQHTDTFETSMEYIDGGKATTKDDEAAAAAELKAKEENLRELHSLIGNSVYLIELLRHHQLPLNPHMSPLLSDDEMLKKLPKTYLITATLDPLMDDSIEFKKRLDKLIGKPSVCQLHILNGLHHGFLNFAHINKDCKVASKFVTQIIQGALEANSTSTS